MAGPYTGPGRAGEQQGDKVVFWCSAFALACSTVASVSAALGCADEVLGLLAPELAWMALVPALLLALLSALGLCSSVRLASKLFRVQLAISLLVLAAMLAGAGCFAFISADATANWIVDGCEGHRTRGSWSGAGRARERMRRVHEEYALLRAGLEACRALNPLVCDLAECGPRARLAGGREANDVRLFGWFRHVQVTLGCGGFCDAEVPLFGLASVQDALEPRAACAPLAAESVRLLGHIFGSIAGVVAMPVAVISMVLFHASGQSEDEYEEVESSDPDHEPWRSLDGD